jgi:predicted nuclease with TOPRIM domain
LLMLQETVPSRSDLLTRVHELELGNKALSSKNEELETRNQNLDSKNQELSTRVEELDLRNKELNLQAEVLTAPALPRIVPGGSYSDEMIIDVVVAKY